MSWNPISWFLLKNSSGKLDGIWSMAVYAFAIWLLHAFVLGLFAGATVSFTTAIVSATWVIPNTFSWASLSGLMPLLGAYIIRRHNIGMQDGGEPEGEDPPFDPPAAPVVVAPVVAPPVQMPVEPPLAMPIAPPLEPPQNG